VGRTAGATVEVKKTGGRAEASTANGVAAAGAPDSAAGMTLADLEYVLPQELVAQHPLEPRDASRLLVVRRDDGLEDHAFGELPALLRRGDVLVRNDTRVFPARAFFRRATGGRIEALFLRAHAPACGSERWEALLRGRPRPGERLEAENARAWSVRCDEALGEGRWLLASESRRPVMELLEDVGRTPLPPYIHAHLEDGERYQTTYAHVVGSAAAPTAGLHFTPAVDAALARAGVSVETLTLHVGLGTFRPLQETRLEDNRLHAERFAVEAAAWRRIAAARAAGRRVIAVGTTTVRTLEHLARTPDEIVEVGGGAAVAAPFVSSDAGGREVCAQPPFAVTSGVVRGETDLFIRPGYSFLVVDGLLTNFHLPRSSLLALVMAFCGVERTRTAYEHAIAGEYRFYSFGDAMLAL
jgi:S-adenosylmethionine:tRNA ribosyltransferase-isomerase